MQRARELRQTRAHVLWARRGRPRLNGNVELSQDLGHSALLHVEIVGRLHVDAVVLRHSELSPQTQFLDDCKSSRDNGDCHFFLLEFTTGAWRMTLDKPCTVLATQLLPYLIDVLDIHQTWPLRIAPGVLRAARGA